MLSQTRSTFSPTFVPQTPTAYRGVALCWYECIRDFAYEYQMLPQVFRMPGFICYFLLFYHVRLQYLVPVVACRLQYDCRTIPCLLPLLHDDVVSL